MVRDRKNGERTVRRWPNVRGDPKVLKKLKVKLVLCELFEMKEVKR
jgi:hypothetical protein